jgi:mono/diheme cytochrome c family protein
MSPKHVFIFALVLAGCAAGAPLPREGQRDPGLLVFNGYTSAKADCYRCHDGNGHGTKRGPNLADRVADLDDAKLIRIIDKGALFMPAYGGKLTDDERRDLVAWLRKEFGGPPVAGYAP